MTALEIVIESIFAEARMFNRQEGFTLIELVAVIVILGILAAVAIPKYISLETDAYDAQAKAAAGAIASASAVNYAKYQAAGGTTSGAVAIGSAKKCTTDVLAAFPVTGVTVSMVADNALAGCTAAGAVDSTSCKVKHASGTATGFAVSIVCTGP
jgi:MSHA pilin protein MshA